MTDDGQQTTDDGRWMTDDVRRTRDDGGRQTTDGGPTDIAYILNIANVSDYVRLG